MINFGLMDMDFFEKTTLIKQIISKLLDLFGGVRFSSFYED